jgi:hypothetical protein
MEHEKTSKAWRIGWCEFFLALALTSLVLELFPAIRASVLWALNPRTWHRTTWFVANVLIVVALIVIRFGPDLYNDLRSHLQERSNRRKVKVQRSRAKEHHRLLEEAKAARNRRIY